MADLQELAELLAQMEPTERIEWLVEQGEKLPPLEGKYHDLRDSGQFMISECQAPVFFMVQIVDGNLDIAADVPREAPVARGWVGFLVNQFNLAAHKDLPKNLLASLSLENCLSIQRRRGLNSIADQLLHPRIRDIDKLENQDQ